MPSSPSFVPVIASLENLLGADYVEAVCSARAVLTGEPVRELQATACRKVEFFPRSLQERLRALLPRVGERVCAPLETSAPGATSRLFARAAKPAQAPLTGLGYFRIGEDGRLRFAAKSEHYHVPLGHSFPGFELIRHARRLGIPNATHNNTRGAVTRRLEEELIRTANGIAPTDRTGLERVLMDSGPHVLNRVLNLQTGSLAAEAAVKLILARFFAVDGPGTSPRHSGRVPVLLVVGDDEGALRGNYHGTTLVTQFARGMWPEWVKGLEESGTLLFRTVRPNRREDLDRLFAAYETAPYKVAGFLHEIVMMNYGARLLEQDFLRRAYELCAEHDAATVADEIQSCAWYPGGYLFREYGLQPDMVAVGKGFSGGEYAAAKILFASPYDTLPQFGALVTNGQEELASLAYLVTMRWLAANGQATKSVGVYYEERLHDLAATYPRLVSGIAGLRHLCGIQFPDLAVAQAFVGALTKGGIDISVQSYKAGCPPVALTKLPLIADRPVVDFLLERMDRALAAMN